MIPDRQRLIDQGFLAVSNVLSVCDLDEVRSLLDPLFDRIDTLPKAHVHDLAGGNGTRRIPEINGTSTFEPRLLGTEAFAKCRALAAELLVAPVRSSWDHAIYKPARCPYETCWHQDQAYTGHNLTMGELTVWIPLQAVHAETGCMRFLRGSHRWGVAPHRRRGGDSEAHALEMAGPDLSAAVCCELEAGGVTVHNSFTAHATGPNASDAVRRAWILCLSPYRRLGLRHLRIAGANLLTRFRR